MRRYAGPSNAPERSPPHQSYLGYTIVTRGSDFRERQVMVFNILVALSLGFLFGRIYQIRRDELERRNGFALPPTARIPRP
jgi:hypothetical protein